MNYYEAAENIEKLQKLTVKDLEGYKELDQVYDIIINVEEMTIKAVEDYNIWQTQDFIEFYICTTKYIEDVQKEINDEFIIEQYDGLKYEQEREQEYEEYKEWGRL